MRATAKLTSKGQITVPKAVRDELGLRTGDSLEFEVGGESARIARVPNLLDLAGTFEVPPGKRGKPWEEVRREAWRRATRGRA